MCYCAVMYVYALLTTDDCAIGSFPAQEKAGETYHHSLRACVEATYVKLFHEYQQTLLPTVLSLIRNTQTTDATCDSESIRTKEAVYKAAGLGVFQLYEEVDFDNWYQTQLLQELEIREPRYRIVRHRVVWLIGNWAAAKPSPTLLLSIYSTLLSMMQPHEDLVIRLTASDSLKMVVDDFAFSAEEFSPNMATCVQLLVRLLLDVKQSDTKMRVLVAISRLLEQMGEHIQPHVTSLLQCLPQLWADSGQENSALLRVAILTTLSSVVCGLGGLSAQLHSFILPIIQLATNVKSPDYVYLVEEGLDLWRHTIYHTPTSSAPLLQLVNNMAGLLGLTSPSDDSTGLVNFTGENVDTCFRILDSYCFLCASHPDQFMQNCAEVIMCACQSYLNEVKSESAAIIVRVLEHLVQLFPSHFVSLLPPILPAILKNLLDKEETHPPTVSCYLSLLARILVQNSFFFFTFIQQMASQAQQTPAALFGRLIDYWSDKLDQMSKVEQRKLSGLAMASLLPVSDECVTCRFGVLVNMCVEVLHDVMDSTDDDQLFDQLLTPRLSSEHTSTTPENEHSKRKKQMAQYDPVHTVSFHSHVTSKLEESVVVHGPANYYTLMQGVDGTVKEQLAAFLPQEHLRSLLALDL